MVFGQSAGAASVSIHTVLPQSWPYFHKAGMASGGYALFASATWADKVCRVNL
jgi:carboxylesterase type B